MWGQQDINTNSTQAQPPPTSKTSRRLIFIWSVQDIKELSNTKFITTDFLKWQSDPDKELLLEKKMVQKQPRNKLNSTQVSPVFDKAISVLH